MSGNSIMLCVLALGLSVVPAAFASEADRRPADAAATAEVCTVGDESLCMGSCLAIPVTTPLLIAACVWGCIHNCR